MSSKGYTMFIDEPLPFIKEFIDQLNEAISKQKSGRGLSLAQRTWLAFCLMGILVTNTVCWAKFERASLGNYSVKALSWMFRHSKIPWTFLLQISVKLILEEYDIKEGYLVVDESDNERSKSAKRIHHVHKLKDKSRGGYINGQTVVLLLLVTPIVTVPMSFAFYMPDPKLTAWKKQDKKLKKKGIVKKKRPPQPPLDKKYPTKQQIALNLLETFKTTYPIKIKLIVADALYGTGEFMDQASKLFGNIQVISQLRCNQKLRYKGKFRRVDAYFGIHHGVSHPIKIRGDSDVTVIVNSARLYVDAHKKVRFVVAVKYQDENEYRYLVASDLSWRHLDIVQAYTLRWLVEVFFEDWKLYEGWGKLAKQPGFDGSSRSLTLSLLLDHSLLLHPEQKARLKNKKPAATVGSLRQKTQVDSLIAFIRRLLLVDDPATKLEQLSKTLEEVFQLAPSKKHMNNRPLGRLERTESLKHRALAACVA